MKVYECILNSIDGNKVVVDVNKRLIHQFLSLQLRQQPVSILREKAIEEDSAFTWAKK